MTAHPAAQSATRATPASGSWTPPARAPRSAPEALVLVGHGRYEDPWHDVAATAQPVCEVLASCGLRPVVRGTFPDALDRESAGPPALVVVIAGHGRVDPEFDGTDAGWAAFHESVRALVRSGVPLLALHSASNTFADSPHWSGLLGGRWVPGRSMHPPIGPATFDVSDDGHAITAGLGPVEAFDERYTDLEVDPGSRVLLVHTHEGVRHPVVWTAPGPNRVLYDALGHDVRSYHSASRRELLRREVEWLLGRDPGAV